MKRATYYWPVVLVIFALWQISGCSSVPVQSESQAAGVAVRVKGDDILSVAENLLGTPYRYGGTTPKGFDCSGLVYYSHRQAGITIPRSTQEQYRRRLPLRLSQLRRGDVVFFRLSRRRISHVGIYAGNHRFIHAPSSGKRVSFASLKDPYWKKRFFAAGRLY
jgi:cell wall-associated NlpC family hydrolase